MHPNAYSKANAPQCRESRQSFVAAGSSVTWIILHRVNPRLCADVQGPGEFYPLDHGL